jgi:Bacteriocin-protection, YdeI or OmpD-Associated/Domain of unknown function (DUF1905)
MKFKSKVMLGGKTATGIEVPESVIEKLGDSKRPAVKVSIGKHTYRTTVARMNGKFMIPLSAEHREGAGVAAGDDVTITIELDTAPREVEVPADFAQALEANAGTRTTFDALAYSHRKEWVRSITDAKTPETRARRIAKAIDALRST